VASVDRQWAAVKSVLTSVDMTVSDIVAARVRQVRKRRDWLPADLAERCAALGAADLTENVIENIESRSARASKRPRPVSVDELLTLALALNVAPVHLLVPPDDSEMPYQITQTVTATNRFVARGWIRGIAPISGDRREFDTEVPQDEYYSPGRLDAPPVQGRWMRPEEDS
jgi:transcriptional regulator with XRE-family HTH domain